MTETDIPPGGEGKIEVSFDSNNKTGKQDKKITVTTNDPLKPSTKLQIKIFVEVEFGFSPTSIGFAKVNHGQSATDTANLLVKDPDRTEVASFKTSSEFILARVVDPGPEHKPGSIPVEITLAAGLPPGRINEFVTAIPTDATLSETKLRVGGKIIGDVEVTPDRISFMIQPGDSGKVTPATRKLTIVNRTDDRPLKIIDAVDPKGGLTLELTTVQEGQRFEIVATPKKREPTAGNLNGTIVISTDNPAQRTVTVRYSIYSKK